MRDFFSHTIIAVVAAATMYFAVGRNNDSSELNNELERWRLRVFEAEKTIDTLRKDPPAPVKLTEVLGQGSPSHNAQASTSSDIETKHKYDNFIECSNEKDLASIASHEQSSNGDTQWDELINGAFESEVERMNLSMDPEKKVRLLSALNKIRETSISLQSNTMDKTDPHYLRKRLQMSVALLEVDRIFRKELNMGVSEFLDGVNRDQIEEVKIDE